MRFWSAPCSANPITCPHWSLYKTPTWWLLMRTFAAEIPQDVFNCMCFDWNRSESNCISNNSLITTIKRMIVRVFKYRYISTMLSWSYQYHNLLIVDSYIPLLPGSPLYPRRSAPSASVIPCLHAMCILNMYIIDIITYVIEIYMYTKIYQDCHLIQLENIRILDICILSHHIIRYSTTLLWSCSIPLPPPLPAKVSSNRPSSCARLRRNGFDAQGRRGCCWKSQQNLRFECKHNQTTCKNMISLGHDLYSGRFSWIFHVLLIVADFVEGAPQIYPEALRSHLAVDVGIFAN